MSDASIVSFINMKGGVGKTTLCVNIADTLVRIFDKKVLLIDIDPQFNATQTLMQVFKTAADYQKLQNKGKTINYILQRPVGGIAKQSPEYTTDQLICNLITNSDDKNGKLDIVPGDLEIVTFESSRRGSENILKDYLTNLQMNYDYILIDTPATYSIYSQSALIASHYYIVPIAPDGYSVLGFSLLNRSIKEDIVLKNTNIKNLGIIFTLVKDVLAGRESIQRKFNEAFTDAPQFENQLKEYERIRTNINKLMIDRDTMKDNIVNITREFMRKIEEE